MPKLTLEVRSDQKPQCLEFDMEGDTELADIKKFLQEEGLWPIEDKNYGFFTEKANKLYGTQFTLDQLQLVDNDKLIIRQATEIELNEAASEKESTNDTNNKQTTFVQHPQTSVIPAYELIQVNLESNKGGKIKSILRFEMSKVSTVQDVINIIYEMDNLRQDDAQIEIRDDNNKVLQAQETLKVFQGERIINLKYTIRHRGGK